MMKDLLNELSSITKNLEGKLLGIGLYDDKLLKVIDNNHQITTYDILNSLEEESINDGVKKKVVYIRKLRKHYKKKKINNIICNYMEVKKHNKYFIKDSVYINRQHLYLFGDTKDVDLQLLIKRYNRYRVTIIKKEFKDKFLLIIDTSKAKNYRFIDIYYFISDSLYNGIELLSQFLLN